MRRHLRLVAVLLALILSACQGRTVSTPSSTRLILASNTILADVARNIAGDRAEVDSLLPFGADPHEYQATPSDVQRISRSSVLIINGLDYERFLQPLLENAGGERLLITASDGLEPRRLPGQDGASAPDPHMWLDPGHLIKYVENIRDGLSAGDPAGQAVYTANADRYIARLRELDSWIRARADSIPAGRRLLVTNHEAMGYFADRYGLTVVTTVIPSVSTEAGASARELAAVIDQVKSLGVPAIFVGKMENSGLARQIAAETGAKVVDDLYLESLTDGPPVPTYLDMMKYDVDRLVQALH
jgi:ABC-type Zn uptake system ZnuABC Zn-binding protein ZnuA